MQELKPFRMRKFECKPYQQDAIKLLAPPEELKVSEWAEKYRMLDSMTSAEPGPWSNGRTPYLVEIMDALLDSDIEEIVFCKCTQVGGTEVELNMLGYVIQQDPSPVEVVYPTETMGGSVMDKRIKPMIRSTPSLFKKFDPDSSGYELDFTDMFIKVVWSNSPSGLASFAMKYLFLDEVDKYPGAGKKEADPISLAKERTKTFRGSKVYMTSTPTIRSNHIWKAKEGADLEKHYFIPCPHCGEFIELRFDNLRWPGKDKDLVDAYGEEALKEMLGTFEPVDDAEGMSNADRAEFAFYICQECGCVITDVQKQAAVKQGHWEAVRQTTRFIKTVAFWINTLYSPFVRFAEIAKEFMESKDDPERLQNFVNSWLGEPWEDTKLKTSAELVLERQTELPEFTVPDWTKLLTAGVDVQESSVYWTIRAWGDFLTSQNIAHGQVYSLDEIEQIMNLEYRTESGSVMLVNLCLIDSGYATDTVYDFCAVNLDWAKPVKGSSSTGMESHFKITTVNRDASRAYGIELVIVNGDKYKDMIADRMHRKNGKGSWMVYQGCDDEYAGQVTAEHKVNTAPAGKRPQLKWVPKYSHADNHYLDAEVYALAAADTLKVRMLHLQGEQQPQPEKKPQYAPEEDWINQNENWI